MQRWRPGIIWSWLLLVFWLWPAPAPGVEMGTAQVALPPNPGYHEE